MVLKLHLDSIFRDCVHLRTHRIGNGRYDYLPEDCSSTFDSSKNAFEVSLGLTGMLALWAWHHEDWREGGSSECVGPSAQPGLHPSLP